MKESHFEKWYKEWYWSKAQEKELPSASDIAEEAWNAALRLAVLQLEQSHRFNAAAQVELLLEKGANSGESRRVPD